MLGANYVQESLGLSSWDQLRNISQYEVWHDAQVVTH